LNTPLHSPYFSAALSPEQAEHVFNLFGLPSRFRLDIADLEQRYVALQSEHHPDRFTVLPSSKDAVQSNDLAALATLRSSEINAAYQQLKHPFERARLLIIAAGITDPFSSEHSLPADFLLELLEEREAFEDAVTIRDQDTLQRLAQEWHDQAEALWYKLERSLDVDASPAEAAQYLRQIKFLSTQIDTLEETLFEWSL
jgi:molecular chaperone HscB